MAFLTSLFTSLLNSTMFITSMLKNEENDERVYDLIDNNGIKRKF